MKNFNVFYIIFAFYTGQAIASPNLRASGQKTLHKVVHGNDNRQDPIEFYDPDFQEIALSVGALVNKHLLHHLNENHYIYNYKSLKGRLNLCDEERFSNEPTLGHCTAFLVAPDVIATAGHCIGKYKMPEEEKNIICHNTKMVFDFSNELITPSPYTLPKKHVYGCKKIIYHQYSNSDYVVKDHALIQLDRPVLDRAPLKLRKSGRAKIFTPLVTIGHPSGLPLKISDDAHIKPLARKEGLSYFKSLIRKIFVFYANLDTFAGNSGSPVFHRDTKEVEGILISGDKNDYVIDKERWCRKVNVKPDSFKETKEEVLRIKLVRKELNKYLQNKQK